MVLLLPLSWMRAVSALDALDHGGAATVGHPAAWARSGGRTVALPLAGCRDARFHLLDVRLETWVGILEPGHALEEVQRLLDEPVQGLGDFARPAVLYHLTHELGLALPLGHGFPILCAVDLAARVLPSGRHRRVRQGLVPLLDGLPLRPGHGGVGGVDAFMHEHLGKPFLCRAGRAEVRAVGADRRHGIGELRGVDLEDAIPADLDSAAGDGRPVTYIGYSHATEQGAVGVDLGLGGGERLSGREGLFRRGGGGALRLGLESGERHVAEPRGLEICTRLRIKASEGTHHGAVAVDMFHHGVAPLVHHGLPFTEGRRRGGGRMARKERLAHSGSRLAHWMRRVRSEPGSAILAAVPQWLGAGP